MRDFLRQWLVPLLLTILSVAQNTSGNTTAQPQQQSHTASQQHERETFTEKLLLRPLPRNRVYAHFQFTMQRELASECKSATRSPLGSFRPSLSIGSLLGRLMLLASDRSSPACFSC